MIIKILGTGCKNCTTLAENTKKAVEELGIEAKIEKVEDIPSIMKYGVMRTPAIVVDEQVKSAGQVLKSEDIKKLLK